MVRRLLTCVILAAVVIVAFAAGVTGGHLGGDDLAYTSACPYVRDGLSLAGIAGAFSDLRYFGLWTPVTLCSFMADVSFFGGGWPAHHTVNVLLHAVNALLAFAFLRALAVRLRPREPELRLALVCAAAALVWAVHPMRVEAVTWIAARKEELWVLFALAGLLRWIAYLERGRAWRLVQVMALFALACLSKPTALCFPFLAYAVKVALEGRSPRRAGVFLPMLAVSIAVGVVAVVAQSHPTGMDEADVYAAPFGWRLLNAAVAVGLTCWHAVCPWTIHFEYRAAFGALPVDAALGLSVLAVVALSAAVAVLRGSPEVRRTVCLASAWFLIGLGPTLGVLGSVNGDQAYADRYAYLPSLAFSFLLLPPLFRAAAARGGRWFASAGAAAVLVAEIAVAQPVVRSYRDDLSAYSRALRLDPDHWRALRVVGNELCARLNRTDEGLLMLRRSLRLRGSRQTAASLAYVLALRGKAGDFAEVRRMGAPYAADPARDDEGLMLEALATVQMRERNLPEAIRLFTAALKAPRRQHERKTSVLNLGRCLASAGRRAEAVEILSTLCTDEDPSVRQKASALRGRILKGP